MELNSQTRLKLEEIKQFLKEKHDWPISVQLICQFHNIWTELYGPLWNNHDTANELGFTLQTIKAAIRLNKFMKLYPDLMKVKNKKFALHLTRTYDTSPDLLNLKIQQEIQRTAKPEKRIIRDEKYMRKNFRNADRVSL